MSDDNHKAGARPPKDETFDEWARRARQALPDPADHNTRLERSLARAADYNSAEATVAANAKSTIDALGKLWRDRERRRSD